MKLFNLFINVCMFSLLCLLTTEAFQTDITEIRVTGSAEIDGKNQAGALEKARQDAFREAVEQVTGALVSARTEIAGHDDIQEKIVTQSSGYIHSFEVLREWKSGKTQHIDIIAHVSKHQIAHDLKEMVRISASRVNYPKVAVAILSRQVQSGSLTVMDSYSINNKIETVLMDTGFEIDAENSSVLTQKALDFAIGNYTQEGISSVNEKIKTLARTQNVELLLIGHFVFEYLGLRPAIGGHHYQASVNLEIADLSSKSNASVVKNNDIQKINSASKSELEAERLGVKIAENIVPKMAKQALQYWDDRLTRGFSCRLTISGIRTIKELNRMRKTLEAIGTGIKMNRSAQDYIFRLDVKSDGVTDSSGALFYLLEELESRGFVFQIGIGEGAASGEATLVMQ